MDFHPIQADYALIFGFLGLGFAVGAYGTLIGAGGGFLLVPALLLLFPELTPASLTGISLTVVFFNAYAGTCAYARMGRINYGAGLLFALAGIPGAYLGSLAVHFIQRRPFDLTFGLALMALGTFLVIQPVRKEAPLAGVEPENWEKRSLLGSMVAGYLGLMSSLLGIGGGILHVPFMIRFLHFPPHVATATSHFVLAVVSLTGTLTHLFRGDLNKFLFPTAFLALGVMMGAPVGAALSTVMRGPLLVRLLAVALGVVGIRLLVRFS